jgi:hypothetical protein
MTALSIDELQAVREIAYSLWEKEDRPSGRSLIHWEAALAVRSVAQQTDPLLNEAEAVVDGNPRADFPALMTKDTSGG